MESTASSKKHALPLRSLNHVSRVCKDVQKTAEFYKDVLGFVEVKRPDSFDFEGCWLFNYNLGVHLIKGEPLARRAAINPKSDHLSFQTDSLAEAEKRLKLNGIEYVKATVEEAGMRVSQIFFHDPDNNMIELCNCDCLPLVPLEPSDILSCDINSPTAKSAHSSQSRPAYVQHSLAGSCVSSHPVHSTSPAVCSRVK